MPRPTALIAEDEPLLAKALADALHAAWPELETVATVGDGASTVREALQRLPDVIFLDIRMPGQTGLDAAAELADRWPTDEAPLPQLVFVTAYDEYAARAFEAEAIDYVLKPVQPARLAKTVARLQGALAARASVRRTSDAEVEVRGDAKPSAELEQQLAQWRRMLDAIGTPGSAAPVAVAQPSSLLKLIPVSDAGSSGATVRMVPIGEVLYFEAADKYVRVLTATHEYLIRTPLKQLQSQLDADVFWQVHRAVLVRAEAIESVQRDEAGKLHLSLRGRSGKIAVSRLYAHLFRAM